MRYDKESLDKKLKAFLAENKTAGDLYVYYGHADKNLIDKVRSNTPENSCLLYVLSAGNVDTEEASIDKGLMITDTENLEHDIWLIVSVLKCRNITFSAVKPKDSAELAKTTAIKRTAENALLNWSHFAGSIMIKLRCSILNLPLILGGYSLNVSKTEDIPVLICGAGPSLNSQIELLKTNRSKIFIITAGRVGSLLLRHGISPDVMVQVDPETDYDTYTGSEPESLLAAIANVSHNSALSFPKIIWSKGDSSYFNKFTSDAGIKFNDFAVSKTSTVTAIDFAVKSGFRKIALIGNDHCLSEKKTLHAEGYIDDGIYGVYELSVKGNDEPEVPSTPELTILRNAIETYLEKLPLGEHTKIFNCTAGGARISFTERLPLETFLAQAETFSPEALHTEYIRQAPDCLEKFKTAAREFDKFIELASENITCTENIIKKINSPDTDPWEFETLNQMDTILINRENYLLAKPLTASLISAVKDQTELVLPAPSDLKGHTDLKFLDYKKRKYQFILDLSMDLKKDLAYALSENTLDKIKTRETRSLKGSRNPLVFTSFRKLAIDFVRKSNPEFADLLSTDYFDRYKANFEISNNWQNIPYVRKFISANATKPLSADYLHMDKIAEKEIAAFATSEAFDNDSHAVVFFAPGNWLHPLMFSLAFRGADIAVIDPWPAVFSEIINCSLFTDSLSENSVIIALDEELKNFAGIYEAFKARMKTANKKILFFEHPQTWQFPEIKKLSQCFM